MGGLFKLPDIRPVAPGEKVNFGSPDHLTQVQHKGTHVDIVEHLDKGPLAVDAHLVTKVDGFGNITSD